MKMTEILVVGALICGAIGAMFMLQIFGIGIICSGGLLALLARIVQASQHHNELKKILEKHN
ncbi:MAG TPA: hypothetical protein VJ842_18440 [Pyrinomonadaceae bacterium]|nr:hypothetical protein [Pyrinomonadaceae bacterium]